MKNISLSAALVLIAGIAAMTVLALKGATIAVSTIGTIATILLSVMGPIFDPGRSMPPPRPNLYNRIRTSLRPGPSIPPHDKTPEGLSADNDPTKPGA